MSNYTAFHIDRHGWRALAVYLACSLINMRNYLGGRFWAEEGRNFYADLAGQSWQALFTHTHHGHLELATNGVVYLATRFPLLYAPLVTTYASFLIQSIPVILIIGYRNALSLKPLPLLAFVILIVGMPQANEVQSNAINLHFHFALLAAVILVLPATSRNMQWGLRGLLLMAGLSGIPANALLPAFAVKAMLERNRDSLSQLLILGATTSLQLYFLAQAPAAISARSPEFSPTTMVLATFSQQVLGPLYITITAVPDSFLLRQWAQTTAGIPAAIVCGTLLGLLYGMLAGSRPPRQAVYGMLAIAGLSGLATMTAIGDKTELVSNGLSGGRYYFAPNCLLFLFLCAKLGNYVPNLGLSHQQTIRNALARSIPTTPLARGLVVLGLLMTIACAGPGLLLVFDGPAWQSAYHEAQQQNDNRFAIWPTGWYLTLDSAP